MTALQVPDTSTTLLRDVADSSHARWPVSEMLKQDALQKQHLEPRFLEDMNLLKFLREIFPTKCEYTVGSMKTTDTEQEQKGEPADFRLDSNRIRTNAEIQLFADVFSITFDEACHILKKAGRRC